MLKPIQYSKESSATKANFDALPRGRKEGTYWDNRDKEIAEIKSEIKDCYLLQQDYACVYCQQRIQVEHHAAWDTEHIIPKSSHPQFMFVPQNLCVACKDCNNEKRVKDVLVNPSRVTFPTSSKDYLIFHPHFDEFSTHIRLLPHSLFFMPKSDKGIKTIEVCGLLRFLLSYADYGVADTQFKKEIALRHNLLQESSDPGEQMILIAELEELMDRLKKQSRAVGLKRILDRNALQPEHVQAS